MFVNFALRFDTSQRVIAKQWERDWWDPVGPWDGAVAVTY